MRRIDIAAFVAAGAATALVAADQGSYFQHSWPWVGLALAAAGALALLTPLQARAGRPALALVAATAAISIWTLVSWFWSQEPSTTLQEALRAPIYIAAAVTFVALAGMGGSLALACGVAAGTTGLAAYALLDRGLTQGQGKLLAVPLGYANALGGLCAIGLAVVVVLGVRLRQHPLAVGLSAAAAVVLTAALALTSSRGSWAALAAALFVAAAGRWRAQAAFAVVAALVSLSVVTAFTTAPRVLQARGDYWHATWQVAERHPLGGSGAGTYDLGWAAYGDLGRWGEVLDAHSLYLETLAELGIIGLVLVLGLVAPAAAALRRERLPLGTSAALAGAVAYLVHTGLDWDWEMPAVTVVGIACLAAACPEPDSARRLGSGLRVTLLVLEAAVIVTYVAYLIAHNV
jgi:O-Antigen ligase